MDDEDDEKKKFLHTPNLFAVYIAAAVEITATEVICEDMETTILYEGAGKNYVKLH